MAERGAGRPWNNWSPGLQRERSESTVPGDGFGYWVVAAGRTSQMATAGRAAQGCSGTGWTLWGVSIQPQDPPDLKSITNAWLEATLSIKKG